MRSTELRAGGSKEAEYRREAACDQRALRARPGSALVGLLLLLVAFGSALRFYDLGGRSLWADELFTLRMVLYHPLVPAEGQPWYRSTSIYDIRDGDTLWTAKAAEQHPPLQDLVEKVSVSLLGLSEFSARLPGALASCALLAWFAWFAARSPDPKLRATLVWALLLLALSPALVAYAKDARPYSLGTSLVGMGALLWLLRWRDGWRRVRSPGWAEVVLLLLACYTHYNAAALVALLLGADLVVAFKTRNLVTLGRLGCLVAAFSAWLVLTAHTILATARGSVAWGQYTALESAFSTFAGAVTIAHAPWVALFIAAIWVVVAWHLCRPATLPFPPWLTRLFFLCSLILVYFVLAGLIVATAGMAHVRFYIFVAPLLAVAGAMLLAELRRPWAIALTVLLIAATAIPGKPSKQLAARDDLRLRTSEDFRSMSEFALRGFDDETVFLFPWRPNRDHYRIYLEKELGQDIRARMVGVSTREDIPSVCQRLSASSHVAVVGHLSGQAIVDDVYSACAARWPVREQRKFEKTFAEHWRIGPGAPAGGN